MVFNPPYPAISEVSPKACLAELQDRLGSRLMRTPLDVQLGGGIDCIFAAVAQGKPGQFCWWIGDLTVDKLGVDHRHLANLRSQTLQLLQAQSFVTTTSLALQGVGARAQLFCVTQLPSWRKTYATD